MRTPALRHLLPASHCLLLLFILTALACALTTDRAGAAPETDAALTLYVDAVNGKDANDGLSVKTPLATLNAAQALMDKVPAEGKVVLNLARGSVFREVYEHKGPGKNPRYPAFVFGRPELTVKAYGTGDKPTISGYDVLDSAKFARHDAEKYPNIWSQKLTPPASYWIGWPGPRTAHPGVLVNGDRPFWRVYTPATKEKDIARDQRPEQEGIKTEEDALNFVNTHKDSFYARDNEDGTVTFFLNSGSDPTKDKLTYEYKVRGAFFTPAGNTWENIRYKGLTHRDGIGGKAKLLKNVEFFYGTTHHMLMSEGRLEDVLSFGAKPEPEGVTYGWFNNTYSLFHAYGRESRGLVYDRCIGKNAQIAFFDHHAEANRPLAVIRDCFTENVDTVMGHGPCTKKVYMVGHRHQGRDGGAVGQLGSLCSGENYIEDSTFRLQVRGGWHGGTRHLRVRNSVFYMPSGQWAMFLGRNQDFEYENVTLILDFQGRDITGTTGSLATWASPQARAAEDQPRGKWTLKNCVIAVINAPNMKKDAASKGTAMKFGELPVELKLDNCVLTYLSDVPETAGVAGTGYVFAAAEDIFAGDPAKGDYTLKAGGAADKKDAGYKAGRKPVFRPIADSLAAALPF